MGLAKQLCKEFRVTLLDFYGFGDTPHPEHALTLDDFVQSVIDIIQFYKMKSVILVSHSFGGRVAIKIASKYGYLLEKMVLIDAAGLRPRRGAQYYYKLLRHKILKTLKIPHKAGSSDYRQLPDIKKKTFVNIVNENLAALLPKITLPTLIIWGNNDKETPIYMARKLNKGIVGSGLVVLKGAGHHSYLDRPFDVLLIIKSFLAEE